MKTYNKLIKELENKKSINKFEKGVILAWMNRSYDCGLKDAGFIIGKKLSQELNKELTPKNTEVKE